MVGAFPLGVILLGALREPRFGVATNPESDSAPAAT
jgi:hypothetical protein